MLYPQHNSYRQLIDLSGFWQFKLDPDNVGQSENWQNGFSDTRPIAVPASWNEQFEDWRDYTGIAWYQSQFDLPSTWKEQKIGVRFNSVNYLADVWLNGTYLGQHEGGHLPFVFDISEHLQDENNLFVVRVDGELAPNRIPPGNLNARSGDTFGRVGYPDANYDFFPYRGIDRPVLLFSTPQNFIEDMTVVTDIEGSDGIVHVDIDTVGESTIRLKISDIVQESDSGSLSITVPDAKFWSPETPHLYDLRAELLVDGAIVDVYTLRIGIRTIAVEGDQLLLNGQPIYMTGFGRHEDFPVIGKGMNQALIIKDHAMMQWMGANSYRTTHYPYSEQQMDIADELGFLVIDETPAVGLFFDEDGLETRNEVCKQMIRELIDRDKNHPSVVMWSVANEPHSTGKANAVDSFREQAKLVRELDPTRLVTLVSYVADGEDSFEFMDVVCINRYNGWYVQSGRIDAGVALLSDELDRIYDKFKKPMILSEFGTDTIPGHHAQPPEMFSEEYQVAFVEAYINLLKSKPYVVGEHVWNLTDFKTSQDVVRVNGYNYKGVLTRDRRPKMVAHRLRELWHQGE